MSLLVIKDELVLGVWWVGVEVGDSKGESVGEEGSKV